MLINGEKYACEACVRGHRVSNCQHSDRPLQHINKKGRPVSQCQHCRTMRKSRSSHVKCDCGEKPHRCPHLQAPLDGHKDSCCCNHGGRCTCSHKKEVPQLDTVPESDSEDDVDSAPPQCKMKKGNEGSRIRSRANTSHSDASMLSFDENGHHKPTHKPAKPSQKCVPYQLHRVNSVQSASSLGNRSVENLLHSSNAGDNLSAGDGTAGRDRRMSKSEAASPLATATSKGQLSGLPPLDLSNIEYPPYVANSAEFFGISDYDQPMFSAGLSADPVDWSHYDGLEFASKSVDVAASNYSNPQSYGGYEFSGSEQMPTLTTSTSASGEMSEIEDFLPNSFDEFDPSHGIHNLRHSAASSNFDLTAAQANMLANADLGGCDFDDLLRAADAGNKFNPSTSSRLVEESSLMDGAAGGLDGFLESGMEDDPAFWMETYDGLPNLSADALLDPSDPAMASLWEPQ